MSKKSKKELKREIKRLKEELAFQKIAHVRTVLDNCFDKFEGNIDARFDKLDEKLEKMELPK